MFWSFHPLADKTNNEQLPKPFFKAIRKSLSRHRTGTSCPHQELLPPHISFVPERLAERLWWTTPILTPDYCGVRAIPFFYHSPQTPLSDICMGKKYLLSVLNTLNETKICIYTPKRNDEHPYLSHTETLYVTGVKTWQSLLFVVIFNNFFSRKLPPKVFTP